MTWLLHGVVLIGIWLLLPDSLVGSRSQDYTQRAEPVALNIADGRGIRNAAGEWHTYYPPGHPVYLAFTFVVARAARIDEAVMLDLVSLLLQALSGALLFALASRVLSGRISFLISSLWLVYPPALYLTLWGNSEIAYIPLFLASLLVFWRACESGSNALMVGAGVLMGLGMLIRPFSMLLPLVMGILILGPLIVNPTRSKPTVVACLLGGAIATILPWQIWTWWIEGEFYLLSSVGINGVLDGLSYGIGEKRLDAGLPPDIFALMESIKTWKADQRIQGISGLLTWVGNVGLADPGALLSLLGRKVVRVWYATNTTRMEPLLMAMQLPLLGLGAFGAWCGLRGSPNVRRMSILILAVVAFFWLMAIAGLSIMRYVVPIMPLVFILIGVAIASRTASS